MVTTEIKTRTGTDVTSLISSWAELLRGREVAYLPVLGPVYSSTKTWDRVLADLLLSAGKDKFLSYDKNQRWFNKPREKILVEYIVSLNKGLVIPVLACEQPGQTLKWFYYSHQPLTDEILSMILVVKKQIGEGIALNSQRVYMTQPPAIPTAVKSRCIFIQKMQKVDGARQSESSIKSLATLSTPVQRQLPELGGEFEFLYKQWEARSYSLGDILCAVQNDKIVGAIGPINVQKDAWGKPYLLSAYFGVREGARRSGYGSRLWQSAINLAAQQGADYALVQNTPNSPATRFYLRQGLERVGEVYWFKV